MGTAPAHNLHATVLGYPRIGRHRRLKRATEGYWAGTVSADALLDTAAELRLHMWQSQAAAGLREVPVNDFSLYDHVADIIQLMGAVPERHRVAVHESASADERQRAALDEYFAMARGTAGAKPLEMTKWFDTNYHYLVPELSPDSTFQLSGDKPLLELREAQKAGLTPRPVLLGPVTFLQLAKPAPGAPPGFRPLELLERLLPVYKQLLVLLADAGAEWVQIDEPALVADPDSDALVATHRTLDQLSALWHRPKLLVATYFGAVDAALPLLREVAVEGVAMDFAGFGRRNLDSLVAHGGLPGKRLVAGVVDGRNVWINDLEKSARRLAALDALAGEVVVSTSCSLLHVPIDVGLETNLDAGARPWLSFAEQKLEEVSLLARAAAFDSSSRQLLFAENQRHLAARQSDQSMYNHEVRDRISSLTSGHLTRSRPGAERLPLQQSRLRLPLLPTTTIGSFPQTHELRECRAGLRAGTVSREQYEERIAAEIDHVIATQEDIGLDVLVHGEPERNDMVQYFAEQLNGFIATEQGWVQSFGTRYVRPPILVGDVSRAAPMTLRWTTYAQGRTTRPVKGMLTGPVTMLAWSFVREDQSLADSAKQIALALRDEIADLERAGVAIIQVDEPGIRELMPLRSDDRPDYLRWSVEAFRLATSGVRDDTQIHTHMCYAEFGSIMKAIDALDVDVISLEAARSHDQTIRELTELGPGYGIGPGLFDIHSPRIPTVTEITHHLQETIRQVPVTRVWANPDCGLKTRTAVQATEALRNMVGAVRHVRASLDS